MSLFPPIRVVSGFGGGRPLKSVGNAFKVARLDITAALQANPAVAISAVPFIAAVGPRTILRINEAFLETNTTGIGAGASISLRYIGGIGGQDLATMNMNSNAIRHTLNAVKGTSQSGVINDTQMLGLPIGVYANLAIGAGWTGKCVVTAWYLEIPLVF